MLEIKLTEKASYSLIQLNGEVDASNSVELDQAIQKVLSEGTKKILVDGSSLDYISSAGLGVFMSYLEDFQDNDIAFVIFGLNEKVQNVFHILGLDQLITIETGQHEALARIYES
jgi:anti-sigma B factor antagonist